jgi:hypothetical protein
VRKSFAVLLLAAGALVGYSLNTVAVKAQAPRNDWFAFNIGETVRLSADLPQSEISCKVTRVENGFIGCAGDDLQRQSARWINLRYVKVITPRER